MCAMTTKRGSFVLGFFFGFFFYGRVCKPGCAYWSDAPLSIERFRCFFFFP